jgi:hypothetical protein
MQAVILAITAELLGLLERHQLPAQQTILVLVAAAVARQQRLLAATAAALTEFIPSRLLEQVMGLEVAVLPALLVMAGSVVEERRRLLVLLPPMDMVGAAVEEDLDLEAQPVVRA